MSSCPLCNALLGIIPEAVLIRRRAHDWHSATFSGQRLLLEIALPHPPEGLSIAEISSKIADHEFSLPDLLVADILVTESKTAPDGAVVLSIEALLLEDEA
jgi:hypothetical protein